MSALERIAELRRQGAFDGKDFREALDGWEAEFKGHNAEIAAKMEALNQRDEARDLVKRIQEYFDGSPGNVNIVFSEAEAKLHEWGMA